jgi:hypothetical protein
MAELVKWQATTTFQWNNQGILTEVEGSVQLTSCYGSLFCKKVNISKQKAFFLN